MKTLFHQFFAIHENHRGRIWENALFVFDTSVLLNLYRYHPKSRDEFLIILQGIQSRIWIPHMVGLEFSANRFRVIEDQRAIVSDACKTLHKFRSDLAKALKGSGRKLIDPDIFLRSVSDLTSDFQEELQRLQDFFPRNDEDDLILKKVDELFKSRTGSSPGNQAELDALYKIAEKRFSMKVPPGYLDENKGKNEQGFLFNDGIRFQKSYSDFIIWTQILEHLKKDSIQNLLFITDDLKEDWWIFGKSGDRRGPRPELIEEVTRESKIPNFLMLSTEDFLSEAPQRLRANVSKETISDVREISFLGKNEKVRINDILQSERIARQAIVDWISAQSGGRIIDVNGRPDIVLELASGKIGFDIKCYGSLHLLRTEIEEAHLLKELGDLEKIIIVYLNDGFMDIPKMKENFIGISERNNASADGIYIVIGHLNSNQCFELDAEFLEVNLLKLLGKSNERTAKP